MNSDSSRILFACESNLVRSPLCAALVNQLTPEGSALTAESAGSFVSGVVRPADRRVIAEAQKHGIDLSEHRTRSIDAVDLFQFAGLISLDEESYFQLDQLRGHRTSPAIYSLNEFARGAGLNDVPDPHSSEVSYEELFSLLQPACEKIVKKFA